MNIIYGIIIIISTLAFIFMTSIKVIDIIIFKNAQHVRKSSVRRLKSSTLERDDKSYDVKRKIDYNIRGKPECFVLLSY